MKKIASLFLVLTFSYNILGFYMMFAEQQQQLWVNAMEKMHDDNFEIIAVTINPYAYIVDSGFEYVSTNIIVKNKRYHVFKKRIVNNVLKLYCLKNDHNQIINNHFKKILDNHLFDDASNDANSSKKIIKSIIKDFISSHQTDFVVVNNDFFYDSLRCFTSEKNILPGYSSTTYPPPDRV